jgi:hypothetical protein
MSTGSGSKDTERRYGEEKKMRKAQLEQLAHPRLASPILRIQAPLIKNPMPFYR